MNEHGDDNPFERFASSTTKGGGEIFYRELWEIILFPFVRLEWRKKEDFYIRFSDIDRGQVYFFPYFSRGLIFVNGKAQMSVTKCALRNTSEFNSRRTFETN